MPTPSTRPTEYQTVRLGRQREDRLAQRQHHDARGDRALAAVPVDPLPDPRRADAGDQQCHGERAKQRERRLAQIARGRNGDHGGEVERHPPGQGLVDAKHEAQPMTVHGRPAARCRRGQAIVVAAPSSSQRPCLYPTDRNVPIISNPQRSCKRIDARLALSPTTAIICRRSRASHSATNTGSRQFADALADVFGMDVNRILHGVAIGRARPISAGISIADDLDRRIPRRGMGNPFASISCRRRHISSRAGGSVSNDAVP